MTTPRARRAPLLLAGLAALATLPGCITATDKFDTKAIVTPEPSIDVPAVVRRAKDQIVRRGGQLGLTIKEDKPGKLTLMSVAPAGIQTGASAPSSIKDDRRIFAVATFRTVNRTIEYTYSVQLQGQRPANTTDQHEREVLAGLFAVREIFEQPLNIDVKAVRDDYVEQHPN